MRPSSAFPRTSLRRTANRCAPYPTVRRSKCPIPTRCDSTNWSAGSMQLEDRLAEIEREPERRSVVVGDLKLYNTRTRKIETFEPLRGRDVRIYVCGLDAVGARRIWVTRVRFCSSICCAGIFEHRGYDVTYVQNVTDIDDRSINRARETGEDWHEIVMAILSELQSFDAEARRSRTRRGTVRDQVHPADSSDDSRTDRNASMRTLRRTASTIASARFRNTAN